MKFKHKVNTAEFDFRSMKIIQMFKNFYYWEKRGGQNIVSSKEERCKGSELLQADCDNVYINTK